MTELKTGDKAPNFKLSAYDPGRGEVMIELADHAGSPVVLYFYPKDDTSGCTAQACDFRDQIAQFNKIGATVLGISRDDIKSHEKFSKKFHLNFPLIADIEGNACQAYQTWVEKSMYGRKYMGIDRSTFLIDGEGRIAAFWRKVKVKDHVAAVAEALMALDKKAA